MSQDYIWTATLLVAAVHLMCFQLALAAARPASQAHSGRPIIETNTTTLQEAGEWIEVCF
jgi:hypothetical protein